MSARSVRILFAALVGLLLLAFTTDILHWYDPFFGAGIDCLLEYLQDSSTINFSLPIVTRGWDKERDPHIQESILGIRSRGLRLNINFSLSILNYDKKDF